MNFGQEIKNEIISKIPKDACCKKALLAGFIRGTGAIFSSDGGVGLQFFAQGESVASYIDNLFLEVFGYEIREISVENDRLNKKDKFCFSVSGDRAWEVLLSLGIFVKGSDGENAVNLRIFDRVAEKECCTRFFFKGLFLASGSCSVPTESASTKTGFHAEISFSHSVSAALASEKLAEFGIPVKITRRKDAFVLYIKSEEEIKDFVAFLGAPKMVLRITDTIIARELSNNTNRQTNCDIGNVNRQIAAAEKHIAAVNLLRKTGRLDCLSPELKCTAIARIDYPDDNLSELAERLNVTKSCLNHRLRKIVSVADGEK